LFSSAPYRRKIVSQPLGRWNSLTTAQASPELPNPSGYFPQQLVSLLPNATHRAPPQPELKSGAWNFLTFQIEPLNINESGKDLNMFRWRKDLCFDLILLISGNDVLCFTFMG
jgi:hypothetical protein